MELLQSEDLIILEALKAARTVQNYIWQEISLGNDDYFDMTIWMQVFQKRVNKIGEIDINHPSFLIELRKRVLQQAALSIQALELIDKLTINGLHD